MTEGRGAFTFVTPIRVRWDECDAQGVVYFGKYFTLFDVAMTEYFRGLGYDASALDEFFTVRAEADFKSSARFDDLVEVSVRCARIGATSLTLNYAIFRGDEVLADGAITYVHADPKTQEKSPVPPMIVEKIAAFEKTPPEGRVA